VCTYADRNGKRVIERREEGWGGVDRIARVGVKVV